MGFAYYILTPFSLLLELFCNIFNNYGLALILFAVVVKLILFPFSLKGKRSMIQMNMLSGKMQKLQKQYAKDPDRYNREVQKLYEKEGVNPMGGCLWSFLPLLILIPLYAIIRQPMKYMMGMTYDQMVAAANNVLNWAQVSIDMGWVKTVTDAAENLLTADTAKLGYNQLYLASLITPGNVSAVQTAAGETLREVFSINFSFLGLNLSQVPVVKFWEQGVTGFGLFLIPVLSAGSSILFSIMSMKTNALNGQQNEQSSKMSRNMMIVTPLISLWIGFSMPAALSIYWIANNLLGLLQEAVCGKLLEKDYAKAAEAQKQRELEEKEEEKRQRREKAERRAREAEEAKKNKGRKKAKTPGEPADSTDRDASRVGIRQYARGRAYDPDRYGGVTPYYEDSEAVERFKEKVAAGEVAAKSEQETLPAAPETQTSAPEDTVPAEPAAPETPAEPEVPAPEIAGDADAQTVRDDPMEDVQKAIDAVEDEIDDALDGPDDKQ